jgi:hypothetical protein
MLISVSTILDSIPFVKVPSYFVALDPLRIHSIDMITPSDSKYLQR